MATRRSVFVTGANGYIGAAVSRAFVRAGWNVYGLIRRAEAAPQLLKDEITPIIGSLPSPGAGPDSPDLPFLSADAGPDALYSHTRTFDAIVGCTENVSDYPTHYAQVVALFRALAATSNAHGVRPLVLWTSGSKDYGFSPLDGAPGLAPHTETSPLETLDFVKPRMTYSLKILDPDNAALFDAAVLRPPNVYGYSSSYYGILFEWAEQVRAHQVQVREDGSEGYEIAVDPRTIISALHVDDCGEAYVALAEHPDRSRAVAGQVFNIGPYQYETTGKLLAALAREYDIPGGFRFAKSGADVAATERARKNTPGSIGSLLGWSQWLGSDKIRAVTGWADKRMLFADNLAVYRRAYEYAVQTGHDDLARVARMKPLFDENFKG
ncbi:hypothetical protein SLS62_000379 [Diatrype stigma]|uniref:NAD-dependent epimerase/dehydratase domain-containing protein n=1 Tax=Diatrype stigma TaxID=117547 RepID=A0AAN9YWN1_9PEZI